ncbi:BON domain-containing protein [Casimicrobium huifangae]|uniref:BON domain-containing protein n=1 Tax=Casimicrobium huifangae TaxID=2591109 RepID=UPI00378364E5
MNKQYQPFLRAMALASVSVFVVGGCTKAPEAAAPAPAVPVAVAPVAPVPVPATTTVGTDIDDAVVTTRVKTALLADPMSKSFDIQVVTRKGQVQLSGFVNAQTDIDNTITLVNKIEGVKGVDNGMTLKGGKVTVGNVVDDTVVTTKVKSALLGDKAMKSFDVAVVTRKGEVQLSGFANDQNQIDRAVQLAKAVDGVASVKNEMGVKE